MSESDRSLFSLFKIGISIHHLNKQTEARLGLSLVQWCLLKQLVDLPTISAHQLSKAVGVHPSTLTQTLKRLEKKKFIFVTEDPKDSRKKIISITRLGKSALDDTSIKMKPWAQELALLSKELHQIQTQLTHHLEQRS